MTKESSHKSVRLLSGFVFIYFGFLSILGNSASYDKLRILNEYSFSEEPVQVQGFEFRDYEEAKIPKRIIIPELSIDLEIKRSEVVNGYWEVHEDSANWGIGSAVPGENGNQVVFAHARGGLFEPIKKLDEGSSIYILTDTGWHDYTVNEIKEVYPSQTEVIAPTDDETLTLYTCSGYADSKRLVVTAR